MGILTADYRVAIKRTGAIVASAALVAILAGASMAAQDVPKNVWEGVYTEAQAIRGGELYKKNCGYCHRDDLTGGGSEAGAPALRGPIFFYRWLHLPLADMFMTIGTTMPQNKPDSLTPQTVVDIVGFLLRENEMPAGKTELRPELEALKHILVTEKVTR